MQQDHLGIFLQHHIAQRGRPGEGSNLTGRGTEDIVVAGPVGTIVKDADTGEVLADLTRDGQTFIVARGGIGGKGNAHFATATHRAPRFAQEGMPGEERKVLLELKLLADVGIIGGAGECSKGWTPVFVWQRITHGSRVILRQILCGWKRVNNLTPSYL